MSTLKTNAIQTTSGKPILNSTGGILQVVNTFKNNTFVTTSTSLVDVPGLSASITPSSASSLILIIISLGGVANNTNATETFRLLRGGTQIGNPANVQVGAGIFTQWSANYCPTANRIFYDNPATTSTITYKLQMRVDGNTGYLNRHSGNTAYDTTSNFILMEISG